MDEEVYFIDTEIMVIMSSDIILIKKRQNNIHNDVLGMSVV